MMRTCLGQARWHALTATMLVAGAACLSGCRESATVVPELRITAEDYGYHMPDSVPAGLVHIVLRNSGKDIHEAMLRFLACLSPRRSA